MALGFMLAGCSTLHPVSGTTPTVGTKVAFDLNDVGRVGLGTTMGSEIAQVEGQVVQKDTSGYLRSVSSVRLLKGGEQIWNGEQVRLRSDYLGLVYERRFSLGRSLALGAVGVGGLTAIVVTRSLIGGGQAGDGGEPCDTCAVARLGRP